MRSAKTAAVIGHFGGDKEFFDGQTVKTKYVFDELVRLYGANEIVAIDTYRIKRNPLKALMACSRAVRGCRNIIMLPAQNGVKVFLPLFRLLNIFKKRRLHYCVIGGWLRNVLEGRPFLTSCARKLHMIYVETPQMKGALQELGIRNTTVMKNFKRLTPVDADKLDFSPDKPLRVCTFSRVIYEKGIEDAINAVESINNEFGRTVYSLAIYGPVGDEYKERFMSLKRDFPPYIRYMGTVEPSMSVETLKDCFALLFPTRFYSEGIPGTVIDALFAGVPIISARWESYGSVLDEGMTSLGYDMFDVKAFEKLLRDAALNPERLIAMRKNCLEAAKEYIPETAMRVLTRELC